MDVYESVGTGILWVIMWVIAHFVWRGVEMAVVAEEDRDPTSYVALNVQIVQGYLLARASYAYFLD